MSTIDYLKTLDRKDITLSRISRIILERITEIPHNFSWRFSKFSYKNKQSLKLFYNKHKGKRCFIIANGPSLNKINLGYLKNEITFAMNRGYLFKDIYGFMPTYISCIDIPNQLSQFKDEYQNVETTSFYNWNYRKKIKKTDYINFIKLNHKHKFEVDILNGFWYGHSVTFACLELAFYLGFKTVYLVGKDHSYNTNMPAKSKIISKGKEMNHFIPLYYKKGMRWDAPDFKGEELAYKYANDFFNINGRKIYDATLDGKLNIFEKISYESLF